MIRNLFGGTTKCRTIDKCDIFGDGSGVALYRLDGNANDESGNYHGTETNVTYGGGVYERGAVFNGDDTIVNTDINTLQNTTGWAYSLWISSTTFSETVPMVIFTYMGYIDTYTQLRVTIRDSAGFKSVLPTTSFTTTNKVIHVVVVGGVSDCRLYIDGVLAGSIATTGSYVPYGSTKFQLGGTAGGGNQTFKGTLDQVRIFNRAITAQEVSVLYNECAPKSIVNNINPFEDGSLKALYKFDDNANDETGVYNGTETNVTYSAGKFGNCAVFNGSSSKVDINYIPTNAATISGWVKTTNPATGQGVFSCLSGGSNIGGGFSIDIYTSQFRIAVSGASGWVVATNVGSTLLANTWYHFEMILNNTICYFYINGTLVYTSGTITPKLSVSNTTLGYTGNQGYLNGSIDQVRFFNKALTPLEVASLYNETTPLEEPMSIQVDPFKDGSGKALYRLDGNALDESGNYNGTPTSVTYGVSELGGRAFLGDGTNRRIAIPNLGFTQLKYSVSVWAKFSDLSNYRTVFMHYTGMMCAIDYDVNSAKLRIRVFDGGWKSVDTSISLNTLYHFVLAVENNLLKAYINNVQVGSIAVGTLSNEAGGAYIGTYWDGSNYPMHGLIKNLRVFNRALTQEEITTLYTEGA